MFFIDESGSMPKFLDMRYRNRYFVIAFVHTDDAQRVKMIYKRAIKKLKTKYPAFFAGIANPNECKGSEMPPFMKHYLLEKLIALTDIRIGHMVVDNTAIEQRFRDIPGRSFNYLIRLVIDNFSLSPADINSLQLKVDNRNTALEGLSELEGYLYNTLVLEDRKLNGVKVEYLESCNSPNIQVADIIAHVVYQRYRYMTSPFPNYADITPGMNVNYAKTYECLYNLIRPRIAVPFVFPVRNTAMRNTAATLFP